MKKIIIGIGAVLMSMLCMSISITNAVKATTLTTALEQFSSEYQRIFNSDNCPIQSSVRPTFKLSNDPVKLLDKLELSINYIIILAEQCQQTDGMKDKEILSSIMEMLKNYTEELQQVKTEKLNDLLKARTQIETGENIDWIQCLEIICVIVYILFILVLCCSNPQRINDIIAEAMQCLQTDGMKDKEMLSSMMKMLKSYSNEVNQRQTEEIEDMLQARTQAETAENMDWIQCLEIIGVTIFIFMMLWLSLPDMDRDGVPDLFDGCPTIPGSFPTGCPDFH